MSRTTLVLFAAAALLLAPLAGVGGAQTSSAPSAFDELSPGGQKIAKALFEAQTGTGTNASKPLTLEEIAKLKQDGHGWGQVFKDMKSQGLVTQKNLGQAVSAYERAHHTHHGPVTTAAGRTLTTEGTAAHSNSSRNNSGGSSSRGGGNAFGHGK